MPRVMVLYLLEKTYVAGSARFFIEDKLKPGQLKFEGPEFHHMVRVTRHQTGDVVRLFDGVGHEADAEIATISRNAAALNVREIEFIPPDPDPQLVLAVPIPKVNRAGWLIEKAVELGVSKLIPLSTVRSVVDPRDSKIETFRSSVVAACKQCGRSRLMEISSPVKFGDLVKSQFPKQLTMVAHPGGVPLSEVFIRASLKQSLDRNQASSADTTSVTSVLVVIGPEGGLTAEEVTQAVDGGAQLVSLGPLILRMETAALLVASLFQMARQSELPTES